MVDTDAGKNRAASSGLPRKSRKSIPLLVLPLVEEVVVD